MFDSRYLNPRDYSLKNSKGTDFELTSNKFVLIDECQDLNLCQIELSKKLAGKDGRLLYVGEPNQAIFGFAGARCNSYQIVKAASNCKEMFLSVCYRCPVSHIKLVKEIFPDMIDEIRDEMPNDYLTDSDISEFAEQSDFYDLEIQVDNLEKRVSDLE